MEIVGIRVPDLLVLELALRLRRADYADTAARLEDAITDFEPRVTLTIEDLDAIIDVLEEADERLAELRGVLMSEHRWRRAAGL